MYTLAALLRLGLVALSAKAAMPATAPPGDRKLLSSVHGTSCGACDGGTSWNGVELSSIVMYPW
jgi:hypothetical protein